MDSHEAVEESGSEGKMYNSDERMTVEISDRRLVCIEYPGVVENVDRALHTLGGVNSINKSIKDETKRLELRFRPSDVYCKPACGAQHKTTGIVLRVRRRKMRPESASLLENPGLSGNDTHSNAGDPPYDGYEYRVEALGTASVAIKFEGMCDFQYLPVIRKADGSHENLLEKLVLKKFTPQNEYMTRDVPLYLNPIMFSRFDLPQDYGFMLRKNRKQNMPVNSAEPSETLAVGRKKRQRFTTVVSFTDPLPISASDDSSAHAQKFRDTGLIESVQELFEERPIWSRSAIMYRLRHNPKTFQHLKDVLPSFAYFFLTGPWRTFWVKFGYDPRKDPGAKKFQGIDFRRREKGFGESRKVLAVGKKKDFFRKDTTSEINLSLLKEADNQEPSDSKEPKLRDFEFHPNILPPYRQMVYMICDIFDPEIQALASKNDGKEKNCDERNGWGVPNFTDKCRSIMAHHVEKLCPDSVLSSSKYQKQKKRRMMKAFQDSADEDADNSVDRVLFEDEATHS